MIAFVDRCGPPEAMACPAFVCDVCLEPIQDGRGIIAWTCSPHDQDHRPGPQAVYQVHRGRCGRALEAQVGPTLSLDLGEVLDQLAHNSRSPFGDDPAVASGEAEYVAPAPSTWRVGHYDRAPATIGGAP